MPTKAPDTSLQDVLRLAEFVPLAIRACQKMVDMSSMCGEVMYQRDCQNMLEEAQRLAREALKKLKGK